MKKCSLSITATFFISGLLILFIFQGSGVAAKRSGLTDDLCSKSKVTFDVSSLKYIFLNTEELLSDPEAFWKNDLAYQLIVEVLTKYVGKVPYAAWREKINEVAKLSEEERQESQYLLMAGELEGESDNFNSTVIPHVCSYFPRDNIIDLSFTVYFTAFYGSYRVMYNDNLIIDVAHQNWEGSSAKILNNLIQVVFDFGYRKSSEFRTEEPLDDKVYRLLEQLQMNGMAAYVGYKARHFFPGADIPDFAMLESGSEVARLRIKLNDLFTGAMAMSEEDLRKATNEIRNRDRAFHVVGAYMAEAIEEKLGKTALVDTIAGGPWTFVRTYNTLVKDDEKIFEYDVEKNKGLLDTSNN